MKKEKENFIIDEAKSKENAEQKGKSFWLELFVEVLIKAVPIILFFIAAAYAAEGLRASISVHS